MDYSINNKFESDVLDCFLRYQHRFKKLYFIVSEIITGKIQSIDTTCNNCRVCGNCVTCCKCGNVYKPKHNQKQCPKCKSNSDRATIIDNPKLKECPHCNSRNLIHSIIKSENKECPLCGSKNIKKPKLLPSYQLTISHQLRNRKQP